MSFDSMAAQKNIHLNFHSEDKQYLLYFEKDKIEQVIINLMSNAFKYTPENGRIDVFVNKIENSENSHLHITIRDTGKGIPKGELPHIFDYFFQASNAKTDNAVGTGIGLYLTKEFVELHHGKINVTSIEGQGSTFELWLPFGKKHLAVNEIGIFPSNLQEEISGLVTGTNEEKNTPETVNDNPELPTVQIIEDNEDLRHFIGSLLKNDFSLLYSIDGEQGIKTALDKIPDLIISDVMMPNKDGIEVCNTLKNDVRTSHIPIILLTAKTTREDRLTGFKSLADEYLAKPFNQQELLLRIQNLIRIRQQIHAHFTTSEILKPDKIKVSSMDQQFLEKLTGLVEKEIDNPAFGVEQLADEMAMSRSHLHRKLKSIANLTPNHFIRSFRLQRAMELLQQQSGTVTEIALQVGFNNPSYFAKCFIEQFGVAPKEVLKGRGTGG